MLAYYQVVDGAEAAMAQALEEARAIDVCIEALGMAVGKFGRARARVRRAAATLLRVGGRQLFDDVAVWSSQRTGLEPEVVNRLRSVGVLTDHGVDDSGRERAWPHGRSPGPLA